MYCKCGVVGLRSSLSPLSLLYSLALSNLSSRVFVLRILCHQVNFISSYTTNHTTLHFARSQSPLFASTYHTWLNFAYRIETQDLRNFFFEPKMAGPEFEQRMAKVQEEHTRRMAEIRLFQICQRGSISTYVSEFLDIAHILQWSDASLIPLFENGLKDDVKDILCMRDRPSALVLLKRLRRLITEFKKEDTKEVVQGLGRDDLFTSNLRGHV